MSNKAIARHLGISAHTVKYHLEAVFAKLGVRSRERIDELVEVEQFLASVRAG